jgi:hypothetical protein
MTSSFDTRIARLEKAMPARDPNDPWDFLRDPGWWYMERRPYNQVPQLVKRVEVDGSNSGAGGEGGPAARMGG